MSETIDGSLAADVRELGFSYGSRIALRGLTFSVKRGEVFGFLGPNGSGKTTAFRVLSTLIPKQTGNVSLVGFDLATQRDEIRRRIGVVFQAPSLDKKLTAYENLRHQGHLFGLHGSALRQRIEELLERVKLSERANEAVEKFSGGMRRRVELAKALLHKPQMLILDEPSTGLDPGARLDLWQYLQQLSRDEGLSCLLTTHYMEEAARCDRLLILNQGECVALGTPDGLRAEIGGEVITIAAKDTNALSSDIREQFGVEARVFDGLLRIEHADARGLVAKLAGTSGPRVDAITMAKPTLDDVFIRRTGHRFWAEGSTSTGSNGNGIGAERKRS